MNKLKGFYSLYEANFIHSNGDFACVNLLVDTGKWEKQLEEFRVKHGFAEIGRVLCLAHTVIPIIDETKEV